MVPPIPVGFLLPAEGRVWPRGVHAGGKFAERAVSGDGFGTVGHNGRLCAAEGEAEEGNARDAPDTDAERRRTEVFDGYHAGVCDLAGVDDD